jgi:hypothetical protein
MINPAELVDNLVALLRAIPELVSEMGGDEQRILAYHDQYPKRASLAVAIHDMPAPGIMAAWQGTQPGAFGSADVWKHQVSIFLRARETSDGAPPTAYYRLFRLITKGVPATAGVPMINATVHPSCYPMDVPSIQRATDAEGLDYFEVAMSFVEAGDE